MKSNEDRVRDFAGEAYNRIVEELDDRLESVPATFRKLEEALGYHIDYSTKRNSKGDIKIKLTLRKISDNVE